jgi:hypothetical protein
MLSLNTPGKHCAFLVLCALSLFAASGANPSKQEDKPKPESRSEKTMQGWTVLVDNRLLATPDDELGKRSIALLDYKLTEIASVVPPDPLEKLRKVTIVLDLTHGKLRPMQYHPSKGWLVGNGYAADLEKRVHIPEADDFADPRHNSHQPWCVLHELAHAYHDQVLDFENSKIREVWKEYKDSGRGENVLHIRGHRTKHYALTDQKEFFAEMTEAYFGMNDFYPFNYAELKEAEPATFALMEEIWGKR